MATTQEQSANGLSSIPLPEIPVKLRCTICSELARGASRLPCCEQSICENCHANLPTECPVCDHTPLSPDDCKANIALRTTVAVFLRTQEKKHNLMLQKEQKEKTKPVEPKVEVKDAEPEQEKAVQAHVSPMQNPLTPPQEAEETARAEGTPVLPHVSQESTEAVNETGVVKSLTETSTPEVQAANSFVSQQNAWFGQQDPNQMEQQMQQMFPGQDFSGPNGWNMYSQMMQGMHHEGWMNGYGNSMMGYGMNSVAQGGGYGGGNFGGMGMNGGGFHNGHDGMGWGWNGQNNVGYNPGMDGTRNGGYYSAATAGGYNHQSHGNLQMPTQQYQNPHFQRQQPYQRGRGGFGNGSRPFLERQQQQAFQDQFQQQLQGIDEVRAAVVGTPVDEKQGEKIPVVSGDPENITDPNDVPTDTASTVLAGADLAPEELADSQNLAVPVNPDMAQYFTPDEFRGPPGFQPHFPVGPRGGHRGNFRGSYPAGRGGFYSVAPSPPVIGDAEPDKIPGVGLGVEGAPTGPKALREGIPPVRGIPIRGGAFGRGRGAYTGSSWNRSMSPGRARPFSRSKSREGRRRSSATGRDRSRDPSRDRRRRSRSRIRDRSRHRKRQSQSVESESDRRGRVLNHDTEEPISPVLVKTLTDVSTAEQDNIDSTQQSSTGRVKRSREESASRERLRSTSKSRSKSPSGHHKRSRRHRRSSPVTERDRDSRDKEPRDRDGRDKDSNLQRRTTTQLMKKSPLHGMPME
ncbi:hypothetical protein DFP73DRAFT_194872 [Morchella snyderi]|nr:hypothetical protein DFP73DRAFT_194872 [Morchella snyderi]